MLEARAASTDVELVALGRPELDLERPADVLGLIERIAPDAVVSAAQARALQRAVSDRARHGYGASKLPGEEAVASANPAHVILRTPGSMRLVEVRLPPWRESLGRRLDELIGPAT